MAQANAAIQAVVAQQFEIARQFQQIALQQIQQGATLTAQLAAQLWAISKTSSASLAPSASAPPSPPPGAMWDRSLLGGLTNPEFDRALKRHNDAMQTIYGGAVKEATIWIVGGEVIEGLLLARGVAEATRGGIAARLAATEESVASKLSNYLLNPAHPVGGTKAVWFEKALGFNQSNAGQLASQIMFDAGRAVQTGVTQYGTKFNQVISITGANGRTIDVTFAWIRNNDGIIRLVTGIPGKL